MPINIEDHKIFIKDLNMEVVPYSIVVQAMHELTTSLDTFSEGQIQLQEQLKTISSAFTDVNKELGDAFKEIDNLLGIDKFNSDTK